MGGRTRRCPGERCAQDRGDTRAARGTGTPLAWSRRSGQGWGCCTGAEEKCGKLGREVGQQSCGLGRDPSAVDGDSDSEGAWGQAVAAGLVLGTGSGTTAAPRPAVTAVSAPLKIWHHIQPQDLAVALQPLRFVWFSCSKVTLFFNFLQGGKKMLVLTGKVESHVRL